MNNIVIFYILVILLDIAVGIFYFNTKLPIIGILWILQSIAWIFIGYETYASIKEMKTDESLD